MIEQVFSIVAPLFIIVTVGYIYGTWVNPEMGIANRLIMDVFMPALIFHVMIQEDFYPRANLGIPLYVFALGDQALDGGVMLVVAGNILCFTIGTYIYSGKLSGLEVLKTPIIIAVILGLTINAIGLTVPEFVDTPISMLGQVAIPLMLFSLGVRLTKVSLNDNVVGTVIAVFCPVVGVSLALLVVQFLPLSDLHANILILFGVLPPAIINFMLAEQYGMEPEKVASIVIIGNLLSIVTIPVALFLVLS